MKSQLETLFNQYNQIHNRLTAAECKLNSKTAALVTKHQQDTAQDRAALIELETQIKALAEQHRAALTQNGKTQSAKLATGCLKWRKNPPSVKVDGDPLNVIDALRRRKLSRFVRVKQEINKTAILAERELLERNPIQGLSIVDGGEVLHIETLGGV